MIITPILSLFLSTFYLMKFMNIFFKKYEKKFIYNIQNSDNKKEIKIKQDPKIKKNSEKESNLKNIFSKKKSKKNASEIIKEKFQQETFSGVFCIPRPDKKEKGGEDSHLIQST